MFVGDTNPSTSPAITNSGMVPSTSRTLFAPARTSDSFRGNTPGNNNPFAIPKPAPPAIKIAGNSNTPCAATKLHNGRLMPSRQHATATTPIINPFISIIHTVPIPVIPAANAANATDMLFVKIPLDASGFTVTRLGSGSQAHGSYALGH